MLLWSIQLIIIYLLLILLVHYLYSFFKNTLTIPKIKDLVNKPSERYNEIYKTINEKKNNEKLNYEDNNNNNNNNNMQMELKEFLQTLHNKNNIENYIVNNNHGLL